MEAFVIRDEDTGNELARLPLTLPIGATVEGFERAGYRVRWEWGDMPGDPCALSHTLVGPDMETGTVSCEVCGYTEEADPDDVAEQERILAESDR